MGQAAEWLTISWLNRENKGLNIPRNVNSASIHTVKVNGRESKAFSVRKGVHQGSVLSPLQFIIVLEALSTEFREGSPMELLYADDLVLVTETEDLLLGKVTETGEGHGIKGS